MPNWCVGALRVRGKQKDLQNFVLNGLEPINASHLDEEVADVLICICELYAMDCLDVYEIAEIIKSKVGRSMKRTQDHIKELEEEAKCDGSF